MSVLRYIAPQFLEENRLCWLRSPLYIVKNGKQESYYFTDDEFNNVQDNVKGEVQRCKGLGALSPDQAHRSMFTDEFQRLDIIDANDEGIKMLEMLMGDSPSLRAKYIFDNIDFKDIKE